MTKKVGMLLVNLGTPLTPSARDVRRYLRSFLSDRRVVEIPRFLWWLILNCVILLVRPRKVARLYHEIWSMQGSPLRFHTLNLLEEVKKKAEKDNLCHTETLGDALGVEFIFAAAMSYGEPGIERALTDFSAAKIDLLMVIPLFPQFSATTQGPVFDQMAAFYQYQRRIPSVLFVNDFADHPAFIRLLADHIQTIRATLPPCDLLLFSFHGLPERYVQLGDPYLDRCHQTTQLLVEALGLESQQWKLAFQSRFGRTPWLKPYLSEMLVNLPQAGIQRIQVVCPGFSSDCLETLEEINVQSRALFLSKGGVSFDYIPCLNDAHFFADWLWMRTKKTAFAFLSE